MEAMSFNDSTILDLELLGDGDCDDNGDDNGNDVAVSPSVV